MGKIFHSLGLLPTDEVEEITAADLMTGYAGQASMQTAEVMRRARGKVLFIDEAYQLNPVKGGSYMQEVVDAMVQAMTSKELKGQIVIILAGYERYNMLCYTMSCYVMLCHVMLCHAILCQCHAMCHAMLTLTHESTHIYGPHRDIDDMLKVNQGLRSRFSEKLLFPDFNEDTIAAMLIGILQKEYDLTLSESVLSTLPEICNRLAMAPRFGNGRDVVTLAQRIFRQLADRLGGSNEASPDEDSLLPTDLFVALDYFLESKKGYAGGGARQEVDYKPQQEMTASAFALPPKERSIKRVMDTAVSPPTERFVEEVDNMMVVNVASFDSALQDLLDARGLNTKEGVGHLSTLSLDSAELQDLAHEISNVLEISVDAAVHLLREWQESHATVREKLVEQEEEKAKAKLQNRKALVPIWRCGVCGRADKPYIACYVRPFIVRYEEVDI
jgi:hypothetical protein